MNNNIEMVFGIEKTVMDKNGRTHTGCFGCPHCNDTGFSYICELTGEKLEGFDSLDDKINKNFDTLFRRNILVGVGNNCPLTTINKKALTEIKLKVSLEEIAQFIEDNSFDVKAEIDDEDENKLDVRVFFFDDGYESNEDFMVEELFAIVRKVERKFDVVVEDGDGADNMENVIISLP